MNKFFATFTLLFSTLCFAQEQHIYVKYLKDYEYTNKIGVKVKVLKGEIFQIINKDSGNDKKTVIIIIGRDSIDTDLPKDVVEPNLSYISQKDSFLQTKKDSMVWVNAQNILGKDTVTLISESGKKIIQLKGKSEAEVSLSYLGKTCRLIISNAPTIFYSTDSLKQFKESETAQETSNKETQNEGETETDWIWWIWALIALAVCGLGLGIWWIIKTKISTRKEVTSAYNNGSELHSPFAQGNTKLSENSNELLGLLKRIENLLKEIERSNNNANEINRLGDEKTNLENKLQESKKEINKLESDKSNLENKLKVTNEKEDKTQKEIAELKTKVIAVDFLKDYSGIVCSYLKFCQQVTDDAYNSFNIISQKNPKQTYAVGHLLMKFQTSINSIPIGNWLQTVQDIIDTRVTANTQIISCFAQLLNDSEKQKEFQRLLFREVLTKYSSNILILAEAFKNLSRFQVAPEYANEIQTTFSKHVTEILNKAKAAGLEIKYVSLFKNYGEYIGQIESDDREISFAYKEVSGLQKDEIAEINSYGIKTNFEDSKTYVILA